MESASLFRHCYNVYFSQPREDRSLYRAAARSKPTTIVQLGIGDGVRTERLLTTAMRFAGGRRVRYVGIDLFEGRGKDASGMCLKDAHRRIAGGALNVKLVPGDPFSGLTRVANSLQNVDWVLIARDQDELALQRAWRYVPRMLHERSEIWIEATDPQAAEAAWKLLDRAEIQRRADASRRGDRTAA